MAEIEGKKWATIAIVFIVGLAVGFFIVPSIIMTVKPKS